ncbi:hypothetical protein M1N60_01910 [Thermodesulfovibrionales bacterium]|nr:hypothetical protein [Thermodesulfovibrionales bacterium]
MSTKSRVRFGQKQKNFEGIIGEVLQKTLDPYTAADIILESIKSRREVI